MVKEPKDPILEEKTQTGQERTGQFLDFSAFIVRTHVCQASSGQT